MLKSRASLYRWLGYLVIGLSLWIRWPVLATGFTVDDYAQLAMMRGDYPVARAPLELFTFSDGSAAENEQLKAVGFFPWWSHKDLRVSLLRPLASALMWLDFRAFGHDAFLYHLHSAAWWVAMLLVVFRLNRQVLDEPSALIALALFSLHPGHNLLLGWIANRNAIVSTTFAGLGLLFQLRSTEVSRRSLQVGCAVLCYGIALAGSEYAIGYLVYGAMLSAVRAQSPRVRWLRLSGWISCVLFYVIMRGALGFGTRGSGMYIDPVREPTAFFAAAAQRFPVLVGDAVLALRSTWWSGGFPWAGNLFEAGWVEREVAMDLSFFRNVQVGLGLAACVVATVIAVMALRAKTIRDASAAAALICGLPLSFVPALASLPESRLMLPPMLGWTVLIAAVLSAGWKRLREHQSRWALMMFLPLVGLVLVEAAAPLAYALGELRDLPRAAVAVRQSMLTASVDEVAGEGKTVFLASAVDPTTTIYLPLVRSWHGHARPASCQLLMGGYGPARLSRIKPNEFVLERLERAFTTFDVYASAFNRGPIEYGARFRAGALDVEVLRTDAGRPMVARFALDKTLDSPDLVLLTQTDRGLVPVPFPPVGQYVVLPAAALPVLDQLVPP